MIKKYLPVIGTLFVCGIIGTRLCYANDNMAEKSKQNVKCIQASIDEEKIIVDEQDNVEKVLIDEEESSEKSLEDSGENTNEIIEMVIPFVEEKDPYSLFVRYSKAIMENDYSTMLGASLNLVSSEENDKAWQSYEAIVAGYEIYVNDNHAAYAVILTFMDSGDLGFPNIDGDYEPSICRYLYVTEKDGCWYADGPLHQELPLGDWWNGTQYMWETTDFGFSDGVSEDKKYIVTQEDMNAFNRGCIDYTQRLFQCNPTTMKYGSLSY